MSDSWPCPHCHHNYPEQPAFLQCTKCGLMFDYVPFKGLGNSPPMVDGRSDDL